MRCVRRILMMATLLAAIPLLAWADGDSDELEQNRRLLEKCDPEHYARLRRDLKAFLDLPADRQKQLRKLDKDLHDEDSSSNARLYRVLERYNEWLQRLSVEDRQNIETAPNAKERLRRIKKVRDKQWESQLPKAVRDELERLKPQERKARIDHLRKQEAARREQWRIAILHWDELQRDERRQAVRPEVEKLHLEVDTFVRDSLSPRLSSDEKAQLEQAKGKWPQYPRTLVKLADKHPIELAGPLTGPARFNDLPPEVKSYLLTYKKPLPAWIQNTEGKWPKYAMDVTAWASRNLKGPLPRQLGPSKPEEFSPAIRQFLNKRLIPTLSDQEKDQLKKARGYWPLYPQTLLSLSRAHDLSVPGMMPGPRELWEPFRAAPQTQAQALPEVPDHTLREFMHKELSAQERSKLASFSLSNLGNREHVKREYFKKHPKELERLRQADQKKLQKHKAKNVKK